MSRSSGRVDRAGQRRDRPRSRVGMLLLFAVMLLVGAFVGVLGYISFIGEGTTTATPTARGANDKPKYSFYDDLPRPPAADAAAGSTDGTGAADAAPSPPPIALISRQPSTESSTESGVAPETSAPDGANAGDYMVQAGAFARRSDADRRKANLALLGIQANIERGVVDGNEVYRVRIGPFASADQAQSMRQRLEQDNIPAFTVRRE